MKKLLFLIVFLAIGFGVYKFFFSEKREINVLIFSKTESFRHESIGAGKQALFELGKQKGFTVDTTEDANIFKEKNLQKYNVIIFLHTTGNILNDAQQLEFNRFIQAGGGFVGVHAAADTEYEWPWYGQLVGAYFNGHPNDPNVREAVVQVLDKTHPSTGHLPNTWKRNDEWYNYKSINPNIKVLMNLDETSYEGGTNGEKHPIAWFHEFDGGRSFYTGLGHTNKSFADPLFLDHLWGGIDYASGPGKPVDYNQSTVAPEENRFQKVVLEAGLAEPMELEILPDGRILFIQRGGEIRLFDKEVGESKLVTNLNVHKVHEDGLLGMTLDPNFESNNWLYLFYSLAGEKPVQHVSRFVFKEDQLDMASEKVILEIAVQRDECCHSAGSLEFGPNGNLFISTGDNTNPHESDGYSPSDEGEGRGPYDAQKSSANTNDLRGKVLRIKPEADGTYSIPEGNLFPKGTAKGRPEIYVMGCRNPYRISIDQHTGYLYWGDVGPDAGEDSLSHGPMGYDEVNQAKTAGFYGWPYFIGNNRPYHKFDFVKKVALDPFDPAKPINTSPNNTGLNELPPARPAFIYYPYGESPEFPAVGNGGRNAMAGPIFYSADYPETDKRFPGYYNNKLFTYDWMRGWIMAVTMEEDGSFKRMERFLPSQKFSNPIDIVMGKDGDMYILEYGSIWFAQNDDARLVHLKYIAGNRPPEAKAVVNKTVGATPLAVSFDASQSIDYDGDDMSYEWYFDGGDQVQSTEANPTFTYEKAGNYEARLVVKDPSGEVAEQIIKIIAGNEPPELAWIFTGNRSFYFDNQSIGYEVSVKDEEDGTVGQGINADAVNVSIDFLERGFDSNEIAMGHEALAERSRFLLGKQLVAKSDCQTCHQMNKKSVGPSYLDIAEKYVDKTDAIDYLSKRIIKGGGGVWGQVAMAAHPQLTTSETNQMVKFLLSLSGNAKIAAGQALKGNLKLKEHIGKGTAGKYYLSASYTDKGAPGAEALTAREVITLRSPDVAAVDYDEINEAMKFEVKAGMAPGVDQDMHIIIGNPNSYVAYHNLDLTGVKNIEVLIGQAGSFFGGGTIEMRIDDAEGPVVGSCEVKQGMATFGMNTFSANISPTEGLHKLYLYFKPTEGGQKPVGALVSLKFSMIEKSS